MITTLFLKEDFEKPTKWYLFSLVPLLLIPYIGIIITIVAFTYYRQRNLDFSYRASFFASVMFLGLETILSMGVMWFVSMFLDFPESTLQLYPIQVIPASIGGTRFDNYPELVLFGIGMLVILEFVLFIPFLVIDTYREEKHPAEEFSAFKSDCDELSNMAKKTKIVPNSTDNNKDSDVFITDKGESKTQKTDSLNLADGTVLESFTQSALLSKIGTLEHNVYYPALVEYTKYIQNKPNYAYWAILLNEFEPNSHNHNRMDLGFVLRKVHAPFKKGFIRKLAQMYLDNQFYTYGKTLDEIMKKLDSIDTLLFDISMGTTIEMLYDKIQKYPPGTIGREGFFFIMHDGYTEPNLYRMMVDEVDLESKVVDDNPKYKALVNDSKFKEHIFALNFSAFLGLLSPNPDYREGAKEVYQWLKEHHIKFLWDFKDDINQNLKLFLYLDYVSGRNKYKNVREKMPQDVLDEILVPTLKETFGLNEIEWQKEEYYQQVLKREEENGIKDTKHKSLDEIFGYQSVDILKDLKEGENRNPTYGKSYFPYLGKPEEYNGIKTYRNRTGVVIRKIGADKKDIDAIHSINQESGVICGSNDINYYVAIGIAPFAFQHYDKVLVDTYFLDKDFKRVGNIKYTHYLDGRMKEYYGEKGILCEEYIYDENNKWIATYDKDGNILRKIDKDGNTIFCIFGNILDEFDFQPDRGNQFRFTLYLLENQVEISLICVDNPDQNYVAWEIKFPSVDQNYPNGMIKVYRVDRSKNYAPVDGSYDIYDFNNKCIEEHFINGEVIYHFYNKTGVKVRSEDEKHRVIRINNDDGNPRFVILNQNGIPYRTYLQVLGHQIATNFSNFDNKDQNYAAWKIVYPNEDMDHPHGYVKVYRVDKSKDYAPVDDSYDILDLDGNRISEYGEKGVLEEKYIYNDEKVWIGTEDKNEHILRINDSDEKVKFDISKIDDLKNIIKIRLKGYGQINVTMLKLDDENQNYGAWEVTWPGENPDYLNGRLVLYRVDKNDDYASVDKSCDIYDFFNNLLERYDSKGILTQINKYNEKGQLIYKGNEKDHTFTKYEYFDNENIKQIIDENNIILRQNLENGEPVLAIIPIAIVNQQKGMGRASIRIEVDNQKRDVLFSFSLSENSNQNYAILNFNWKERFVAAKRVDKSKDYSLVDDEVRVKSFDECPIVKKRTSTT